MPKYDAAGRQIAGLLGYNPGPGIYSRLERAVQQMPENVRVQELPGLLKRYKDGVPGWELKATNLDEVIAGRDVVPREELLARVREASPVYTHKEVVLGGRPALHPSVAMELQPDDLAAGEGMDAAFLPMTPSYQQQASPLGQGVSHGEPRFERFGQGGSEYTERLLLDPASPAAALPRPHHFHRDYPAAIGRIPFRASRPIVDAASAGTVGHMRYDRHGDALRLNELQSDLHNFNIKSAKAGGAQLPFVGSDATRELLLKQFLLDAARQGAAVEIASPHAVSEAVNMPLDHAQHLYGKVYPSDLDRMGRKLGGLTRDDGPEFAPGGYEPARGALQRRIDELHTEAHRAAERATGGLEKPNSLVWELYQLDEAMDRIASGVRSPGEYDKLRAGQDLYNDMIAAATQHHGMPLEVAGPRVAEAMPSIMRLAEEIAAAESSLEALRPIARERYRPPPKAGYRAVMSDEMRRRIIEQGIGAALMAPIATEPVNGQAR